MKPALLLMVLAAAALAAAVPAAAQQAPAPAGGQRLETKLATTPSRIVPVDRIVAVVNDEVITANELGERVQLVVKQMQRGGGQLPPADVLRRTASAWTTRRSRRPCSASPTTTTSP